MILYGAGGHAKVVYDSLLSEGIKLGGIFDDSTAIKSFIGYKVVNPYSSDLFSNDKVIISIGSNEIRYELSKKIQHEIGSTIHSTAFVGLSSEVNIGAMVMAKAAIQTHTQIGKHVIINTGAIVEHDCMIEDYVHVGPGTVICGNVRIGTGALIGANATILPGLSIGKWAIVGAGTVVRKNVEDGATIFGNPAKISSN